MSRLARVVVVTFSPGEVLEGLLDSLAGTSARGVEVVLADNGSVDGAPERAARERPEVRVLHTGGNVGYGSAVNAAMADVRTGWVLVANPDVRFLGDAVGEMLAAADRWPRAATVGPLIRTPEGEVYPSARDVPSMSTGIGHALLGFAWPRNPWTARYRREREAPRERPAGWLSGACLLVDAQAFHSVGGFDPAYFMYFEDVDLGDRLGAGGWRHVYAPSAEIVHEGGHSTKRVQGVMRRAHHVSALRFLSARHPGPSRAPLRLALRAGLAARLAASSLSERIDAGAAPAGRDDRSP
ncbi:glycosyltransferase family 2 protein [Geodermatophilaceae bacterium NBWT11]|nr:glycosyltransferase family 2 protein [Geodermatophilaceae bacterium NBWT11]